MAFQFDLNLNDTFGAYTLGTFASSILFGVTCFQTYHYFNTYTDDGIFLKLTVITVSSGIRNVACGLQHSCCIPLPNNGLSESAVSASSRLVDKRVSNDAYASEILFGVIAIVVLVVQLFYAWRIYIISRKKNLFIPIAIFLTSPGAFGRPSWRLLIALRVGVVLTAVLFRLRSLLELPGLPETLAKISLSTAVAIDVTIAATLSYFLHSSRTGIKQTDKLINRLMKYTINNGVLTTVFDIITLTLVITRPRDLIFLAFSQVLASLYSNSFLATLNSRRPPASSHAVVNSNGISLQTIHFGAVPGAMVNSDSTSSPIENDSHKDRIARLAAEQVV
uniref:DUF6534 domain-containing protein n=1 Tax=Psilocybe cubensis TaxID=181762 RepID=A0A8H7Y2L0_PSICU